MQVYLTKQGAMTPVGNKGKHGDVVLPAGGMLHKIKSHENDRTKRGQQVGDCNSNLYCNCTDLFLCGSHLQQLFA